MKTVLSHNLHLWLFDYSLQLAANADVPIIVTQVTLQKSSVLCGFGKAKFKEGGNNETLDTDTEIPFEVNDGTYAVLDNQFGTIGEHLSKANRPSQTTTRFATTNRHKIQMASGKSRRMAMKWFKYVSMMVQPFSEANGMGYHDEFQ